MSKISENTRPRLNPDELGNISPISVERKFGRPEDFIEIYIADLKGNILDSIPSYSDYDVPSGNVGGNLTNEINLNPKEILEDLGYITGTYDLFVNIQKRKIFNSFNSFKIHQVSPNRTELKLSTTLGNTRLNSNSALFIRDIKNSPFFRDFTLNFGGNQNVLGVNLDIDKSNPKQFLLLVKLLKPLPGDIKKGSFLTLVEDIVEPIRLRYDLGELPPVDSSILVRGPNFKIDTRLNGSVSTAFKSYDNILSTNSTSSYQKLLSKLDGHEVPEIDYSYIKPVSTASLDFLSVTPSHFENFVHFGSATERLKNFEYKLKLIDVYDTQLSSIRTITGDTSQSSAVLGATSSIENKKENLIQGFDGYEQFLYFESGTYSWPKSTSTEPYILENSTSSIAKTWLGSSDSINPYYGGQLNSSSIFDLQNPNRLNQLTPTFIGDNLDNEPFMLFCDMVGNHFDPIWAHIKEITQIRDNSHKYGISKNLVYYALQSMGIKAYDQFENKDLIDYMFGETFTTTDIATVVTASNETFSKQDITKEVWKRLYHNAPYLLKTKGTERGLRALINCYGVPDTILDIKEYGGSSPNKEDFKLYSYNKYMQTLTGHSRDSDGFFLQTEWSSSITNELSSSAKTVEFRIKPTRAEESYHLFSLSGSVSSSDLHLLLEPYTGSDDFYSTDDKKLYGKLNLHQFTSSIASSEGVGFLLGPELFTNNNDFSNGLTGWVIGTVVESGGVVSFDNYNDYASQNFSYTVGKQYAITFNGTGNLKYRLGYGGVWSGVSKSITPNQTVYEVADSDFNRIQIYGAADNSAGTLTSVSIKEVIRKNEYFPVYNDNFWDIFIGTDGISGSYATCSFGAYQSNYLREVDYVTSSVTLTEQQNAESFGNHYYNEVNPPVGATHTFIGGIQSIFNSNAPTEATAYTSSNYTVSNTGSAFDLEYSGSLSEVRYYFGELLSHETLKKHALEPLMYAGNSISSSFDNLILRYPLSFELNITHTTSSQIPSSSASWNTTPTTNGLVSPPSTLTGPITGGALLSSSLNVNETSSASTTYSGQYFSSGSVPLGSNGAPIFAVSGIPLLQSHHPNEKVNYLNGYTFLDNNNIELLEEIHHLPTPNTIGKSAVNRKIRIDSGSTDDDILSPNILSQIPSSHRQAPDFDSIGVFLSPQNEINEDIIYTLGTFSLDEFLGDPRDQTSNSYPQFNILQDHYFKKLERGSQKQNIFDFTRWVQFMDHTLFDLIKQFTPQKSTTKTGLLIEPHYLERVKFPRFHPSQSNHSYDSIIQEVTASFHKNNNFSQLNNTTGSSVVSNTISNGLNTSHNILKYFTGSSVWEQGPLKSQYPLFLDFNHYANGTDVDDGGIDRLSTSYGTAGDSRTIEGGRLKIVKLTGINTGVQSDDIPVKVGQKYRFSLDTTGNPGNIVIYHGDIFTNTNLANNSGYGSFSAPGPHTSQANGSTIASNTEATGSIVKEFVTEKPYLRFYFRANGNHNTAGTTFFDNIILEELDFKQRNSSGSNALRPWALTPQGNFMNSRVSKIKRKSLFENKLGPELLNTSLATSIAGVATLNSSNKVTFTANGTVDYVSPIATELVSGRKYKATATISGYSDTSGTDSIGFSSQGGLPGIVGVDRLLDDGDISFTFTSDGNEVRIFAGNGVAGVISNMSCREINPQRDIEFDDSLIDMASWKLPRYEGSKLTGAKINEYTVGDISYGLNPVIEQKSTAIYFGKNLIGTDGEDDSLVTIKNHSYIDIEKILIINKDNDTFKIIDLKNEEYKGVNGYIANDFKDGSSFNIELLDNKIHHKLKDSYSAKFNQGYLYKVLEHKGKNGTGNIYNEGIQVGYLDVASTSPYATSTSQNVFCYGNDSNTMNSDTLTLKSNTLTKKIWPVEQSFGRVDFITSSLANFAYSSMENLGMFINSMLIPVASESQYRLFGTFNLGQPIQVADYTPDSNQGIKSISTAEFDLEAYVIAGSLHDQISGSSNMSGFGRTLVRPDHLVIPIMQGHHDIITDKKAGAGITWPINGGTTGGSHTGATDIQLQYYFGGNSHVSAIYQISYLEETNSIIADIDKPIELANDVGDEGYILIPDNLDKEIKDNIDFYLHKAGIKNNKSKKSPKRGR
tara:strand:+ start:1128 stop:7454 length:6327 start_codon:yes stop_codon:yes gene_type:complete